MTSCLLQLSDRHCRRCDEQASATPRHRQDPARDGGSAGADRCLLADQPRRSPNLPRSRRAAPASVFLEPTSLPVRACYTRVRACSFLAGWQTRQAGQKYEMKQNKRETGEKKKTKKGKTKKETRQEGKKSKGRTTRTARNSKKVEARSDDK